MVPESPLQDFHPVVRQWFEEAFGEPSPPQKLGWPGISSGRHTLILAPTGSGKTLAAFLWAINHVFEQHLAEELPPGVRILYISPLKALNNDVERNLEHPLSGIKKYAQKAGLKLPPIHTAVRTGDTPQSKRAAIAKHPPDILITTPESLYLMLTSKQTRKIFRTVQYVIVDEIHSLCNNKRGVHLSLSLERLAAIAEQEFIRIGLSATQRPLDKIARFLGGQVWEEGALVPRKVNIVDAGQRKQMDLRVECAPPDFSVLPQASVWPLVLDEIYTLIQQHRTTLIFVNNRRLAERIAAKLNELATGTRDTFNLYSVPTSPDGTPSPTVPTGVSGDKSAGNPASAIALAGRPTGTESAPFQAYHGSMSRHARQQMEADLKQGKLRALVATSSLELGIDIGSIDLVIQLQSPKGVARGLQRIGRSGHLVTATSKGRIFPTHREDLVESAVVARAMQHHDVEMTAIPHNCLDVLAQQIVAMVSVDEWEADKLYALVRQSYCYENLPEKLLTSVLRMLAGRFTAEAFRELRARISWDRVNNVLRPLPGSAQLAITSGGTISDRGYFGVYLPDGKTKVGEVDEEFVYESRTGDTFILGTSVWRMTTIDANKILVEPAPGQPARMPFWRGEGIGRSFELGRKVGEFRREMAGRINSPDCLTWLAKEYPIDSRSAWNLQEYFRKQQDATGIIPHDLQIVVEGFRDEIGDPRIVVHSPFGRRVNGLLGLVCSRRLMQRTGVEPQMLYNDDGVLLRCPDVDALPLNFLEGLTRAEAEEIILSDLLSSPLFGGQFRQNAARALLMPKIAPGKRTPLWLQRLRAKDLLQIARQVEDFPIVIETIRDVLHDVLDFEHFREIAGELEEGRIRLTTQQTEVPSPFTASLLFDFIAVYMYEWDQPREDRLSQYVSINRELLSEVLQTGEIPSLLKPEAIEQVESRLQHTAEGYRARSPEELMEILVRIGDLSDEEIALRSAEGSRAFVQALQDDRRAVRITIGNESRWIAGEEKEIYAALANDRNAAFVLHRFMQYHGPVATAQLAQRFGFSGQRMNTLLEGVATGEEFVRGRFSPEAGNQDEEWCYRPTLEHIHRTTLGLLRKEIQTCTMQEFTLFLLHWHHLQPERQLAGNDGLERCAQQMQGLALPAEIWERDIFRGRIRSFETDSLARLTSSGTIVWTGAGAGKLRVILRGEGALYLASPTDEIEASFSAPATRVLAYLRKHGASFFNDLRDGTGLSLAALNDGIGGLFWSGLITNDVLNEVMGVKRPARQKDEAPIERIQLLDPYHNPRRGRAMQTVRRALKNVPGWNGRWSLVHLPGVMGDAVPIEEQASLQALQLLDRYGILAREFWRREDLLPWPLLASALQRKEMRGEIRRGYFVEGLSGMQYALPEAVEELRRVRSSGRNEGTAILMNACDPASPFGGGIPLTLGDDATPVRFSRIPGNYIGLVDGKPVLLVEGYGTKLTAAQNADQGALRKLLTALLELAKLPRPVRPFKEVIVEYCNDQRPTQSPLEPLLRSLGFMRDSNQRMRWDGYA